MPVVPASVVVVSRNRPEHLRRCLTALGQLDYPVFEVIVVACPAGVAIADQLTLRCVLRVLAFDRANISEARNIGIADARGDVVAFIDDDAVPEPTWLAHLTGPFGDETVAQCGGTTLGRNGISVQHAAARVDGFGVTHPVVCAGMSPMRMTIEQDLAPRLHGTNMAVRRDVLLEQGGFDQRFRFYLDETDLTRRVALAGGGTVFAPMAAVHHASAPSAQRRGDRVPLQLFEIGASGAVFHQKHAPDGMQEAAKRSLFDDRRNWLLRHMQKGTLTPDDVHRLLAELARGYEDGLRRSEEDAVDLSQRDGGVIPSISARGTDDIYLVATRRTRTALCELAAQFVASGKKVTVFDYAPSARFHRVTFADGGYWLHTGGIYGRELRSDPLFRKATRAGKINQTLMRLKNIRSFRVLSRKNLAKPCK